MDETFFRTEIMMDSLCHGMGDYAPAKRRLIADYKGPDGTDIHQDLVTWHDRRATDEALVQSVREELAGRGCTLTALGEFTTAGKGRALYLRPGYLEEALAELGLAMPTDLLAALDAAGGRPVNWRELAHGG